MTVTRDINQPFDEVIERAARTIMKQAVASRIDLYRDVWINGERAIVRVKITAEWAQDQQPKEKGV
jgi:hypothetical protein